MGNFKRKYEKTQYPTNRTNLQNLINQPKNFTHIPIAANFVNPQPPNSFNLVNVSPKISPLVNPQMTLKYPSNLQNLPQVSHKCPNCDCVSHFELNLTLFVPEMPSHMKSGLSYGQQPSNFQFFPQPVHWLVGQQVSADLKTQKSSHLYQSGRNFGSRVSQNSHLNFKHSSFGSKLGQRPRKNAFGIRPPRPNNSIMPIFEAQKPEGPFQKRKSRWQ